MALEFPSGAERNHESATAVDGQGRVKQSGLDIAIGVALGATIGTVVENIRVGIATGIAFGVTLGAALSKKSVKLRVSLSQASSVAYYPAPPRPLPALRLEILAALAALLPFVLALAGDEKEQVAEGIARAIREVCTW